MEMLINEGNCYSQNVYMGANDAFASRFFLGFLVPNGDVWKKSLLLCYEQWTCFCVQFLLGFGKFGKLGRKRRDQRSRL